MSKIQTAIIALSNNNLPSLNELFDYLTQQGCVSSIDNLTVDDQKITFRDGTATYAVMFVEGQIPTETLQGPCSLAWHWPEAALEFNSSSCHLIAGVLDESAGAVEVALRLTYLTAAICSNPALKPVGVLWTGGTADNKGAPGCVHKPEEFVAHSHGASKDAMPIELWVSFLPIASDKRQFIMTTRGMTAFGVKELETTGQGQNPQWVYEHLFNFAHFYLTHPEDVKENQTIGMSNDEKIDILAASSRLDPNRDVLMLNFDAIETNRQIEEERNNLPGVEMPLPTAPASPSENDDLPRF